MTETMKAVRMHDFGEPEVLKQELVPLPELNSTDILVRVRAAGINPHDLKTRDGTLKDREYSLPLILGWEISGVVEAVGRHTFRLKKGDEVFGYPDMNRPGGYAEYIAVDESSLVLKPENISHEEAAAFPVGALTAWQGIFGYGCLQSGQTILIHGGAGAVGSQAIQLALLEGAKVITTASDRSREFVSSLGAEQIINYRQQKFEEEVSNVDVVLDLVGGDTWKRSLQVLKPGGQLVSVMMDTALPDGSAQHGVNGHLYIVQPSGAELERIANYIREGKLKARVDRTFTLEQIAGAHRYMESNQQTGKIIVTVA